MENGTRAGIEGSVKRVFIIELNLYFQFVLREYRPKAKNFTYFNFNDASICPIYWERGSYAFQAT